MYMYTVDILVFWKCLHYVFDLQAVWKARENISSNATLKSVQFIPWFFSCFQTSIYKVQ